MPITPLPVNEYRLLQLILDNPVTDENYDNIIRNKVITRRRSRAKIFEVPRNAAKILFGSKHSWTGIYQGTIARLEERNVLTTLKRAYVNSPRIVLVHTENVEKIKKGLGRPSTSKRGPGLPTHAQTSFKLKDNMHITIEVTPKGLMVVKVV